LEKLRKIIIRCSEQNYEEWYDWKHKLRARNNEDLARQLMEMAKARVPVKVYGE